MLDPFLPEKPDDVERIKAIQQDIHDDFIALVKARRGDKLDSRETALFSGEYWAGKQALELGLVDAIGDLRGTLRKRYGEKVRTPLIVERGFLGRRTLGIGHRGLDALLGGANVAEDAVSALEARALWARYGL